jgi:integrase
MKQLRPSIGADASTFAQLLHASLADSTWDNYDNKLQLFQRWCATIGVDAFPASNATAIRYICYLFDNDTVHGESLKQYLSSVNRWHSDLGSPEPFTGRLIKALRRGFKHLSVRRVGRRPPPKQRFTSAAIFRIAAYAMRTNISDLDLRACAAVIHQFLFTERADSVSFIRLDDYVWQPDGSLFFTENWRKGDASGIVRDLHVPPLVSSHGSDPLLVLRLWHDRQSSCLPASALLFQLRGKPFTAAQFKSPSGLLTGWLRHACACAQIPSPAAGAWSSHALRRGSATAALSIAVTMAMVMAWGGWKTITSVMQYVDPLVRPTDEDRVLFSHLLR